MSPEGRGRPTIRTPEIEEALLVWIAEGETLRAFCRQANAPAWRTVYNWLEADEGFSARFARARRLGHDAISEQTMELADTPQQGEETVTKPDGSVEVRRGDMLGHRKLQIETRLKLLAKWDPKRWGDRTVLAGDPEAPLLSPGEAAKKSAEVMREAADPNLASQVYADLMTGRKSGQSD